MTRAWSWVLLAYAIALAAGVAVGLATPMTLPWQLLAGDLAATLVIFAFSVGHRNASFYDPYWSVVPPALAVPIVLASDGHPLRTALVCAIVVLWAVRLTANWARGWTGLDHEDWRYGMLREQTGALYPFVNFAGIHLFPTLQVFLGSLPLVVVLADPRPIGVIDLVAGIVGLGAVTINHVADEQLRAFRAVRGSEVLRTGVWAWSRHPNYLGEMGFWWSLFLFAVGSGAPWWCYLGAPAITAMFVFITIPMIERRMVERRPAYSEVLASIPMVLPRPPRNPPPASGA